MADAMPSATCVELPGGRISYRTMGEAGRPIVLLHGGGVDNGHWTWRWLAHDLATDHRVFVPDQPKHGDSWPWYGRADQRGQEDMLGMLLDHWELPSATLIGLSLGATTAIGYALRHARRVERLVLTSSGGLQDRVRHHELAWLLLRTPVAWLLSRTTTAAQLEKWVRRLDFDVDVEEADIDALATLAADELRAKRRHSGFLFSDWNRFEIAPRRMRTDFRPRMAEIACPTLFVHGARDTAVPTRFVREAASRTPLARLALIEGAGHFVPVQRPKEYAATVRSFLGTT